MDPPVDYSEHDAKKKPGIPTIQLRPYQEVDTNDEWSIDPKVLGKGVGVATEAQEEHVQGAAMLKAQCKTTLCNFPDDE